MVALIICRIDKRRCLTVFVIGIVELHLIKSCNVSAYIECIERGVERSTVELSGLVAPALYHRGLGVGIPNGIAVVIETFIGMLVDVVLYLLLGALLYSVGRSIGGFGIYSCQVHLCRYLIRAECRRPKQHYRSCRSSH